MGKVLFVSQNPLGRCENLESVYRAYLGPKEFQHGLNHMLDAEVRGFSVVVCDALPQYIAFKDKCKMVVMCHGMTGNKVYGVDEGIGVDPDACAQVDVATAASEEIIPIVARELGISEDKVKAVGFPRTDAYFYVRKGCGGTEMEHRRGYLYVPTFRNAEKGGYFPLIDWEVVDDMLEDDELVVVKRHYFTEKPLLGADFKHVREADCMEPLAPYLYDCDVVLTDYSSVLSDAYLLGKNCILIADDMDEYLHDRPMYFPYPETYCSRWLKAEGHEEELVKIMRDAVGKELGPIEERYRDLTAGSCDGHSVERTCELIRRLADEG